MVFEQSLYSYLTSKTAITSVCPTISPNAVSEGTAYPFLTYHILGKDRVYNASSGPVGKCTIRLAIDIESTDYLQTITIAEAVRNELEGFRGNLEGTTLQRCLIDSESDNPIPPVDSSDNWCFHREIIYVIDAIEALPVQT